MIEVISLITLFFSVRFLLKKYKIQKGKFFVKGKRGSYSIKNLDRGIIAIGGAGSGKTFSIIKPLLAYNIQHRGVLTFDPKGELSPLINKLAQKYDKPIINFSLDNNLDTINPITLCQDKSDVIEFSSYFLSGIIGIPKNDNAKYFFNAAKSVLTGVIIYFKNVNSRYATIPHVVALFLTTSPEGIIELLSSNEESKRAASVLSSIKKDPKLLGSIISTFTAFFSVLDTPKVFRNLISEKELELPNNPNNPNIINLIFNLQKRDIYTPIYSSIIGLIIKKMNIPNQYPSSLIIDEFTALSIPNFVNIPETARSNKIATCLAIQDLSQLIARYGKENASSLISNMGSQFLFRTTNPETLDHFEKMLGSREVENISKTTTLSDFSSSTSKSKGVKEKNILRKERVINYKSGQVFGIIAEGNKSLIENDRINGNHYLKGLKNLKANDKKGEDSNENIIYQKVYRDIKSLFKEQHSKPVKFNI